MEAWLRQIGHLETVLDFIKTILTDIVVSLLAKDLIGLLQAVLELIAKCVIREAIIAFCVLIVK